LDMGMFTKDGNLYPKVYSITMDYTVVHEHDLGFDSMSGPFPFGSGEPGSGNNNDPFGGAP